jgi:hypothetical protein
MWLFPGLALSILAAAFSFLALTARPFVFDTIQPGMTEEEVSDLLRHDGTFEWVLSDGFGYSRRSIWESADDDRITLVFGWYSEHKFGLTDKSLTPAPINSAERIIRRIRRKIGY